MPELADLLDGAAVGEVLTALAELQGVRLTLADTIGRVHVTAGRLPPSCDAVRATLDGGATCAAMLARFSTAGPQVGCSAAIGLAYQLETLCLDGRPIGQLVVGPYRTAGFMADLADGSTPTAAPLVAGDASIEVEHADDDVARLARLVGRALTACLAASASRRSSRLVMPDAPADRSDVEAHFAYAAQRVKEVDEIKTNFLANVSHELRTPLTSVLGYSEILLSGLAGSLNQEQKDCVRVIMEKGGQLLALISGILDVSRIEAGTLRIGSETIDLAEEVGRVAQALVPLATRKRLAFTMPSSILLPPVRGDREKIRQILFHVVDNAIKFTPEGGTVELRTEFGALDLDGTGERRAIRLLVLDTGIGIHRDLQRRIFEPFFQADASSTRPFGGAGLGLALVKTRVEAHGGKVWVDSEPGKGSVFTITFPVADKTT